jgi:hypothetical protein
MMDQWSRGGREGTCLESRQSSSDHHLASGDTEQLQANPLLRQEEP